MDSMVDPRHAEHADDLLVVESPSLRERLSEPEFFDRSLLRAPFLGLTALTTRVRARELRVVEQSRLQTP